MKKILVILLSLALLCAPLAACGGSDSGGGSGDAIKVGIVNLHPSESGYREANVADMDNVFNAANGYEVLKANYNTLNEQLDAAQQFVNEGVDYLLISAADASGWDSVLQAAKDAGIKVFLFDRMIDASSDLYEAAVVSDMVQEGKNAVAWLEAQARPGGYKIIHINGQMGSAAQQGRSGPMNEAIAAKDDWVLVREGTGGDTWSADEAKKIVEAAIQAGEDFNLIYAHNDGMAEGAMIALQEAGISHGVDGDVWIIGFDFNRFALRYVQSGEWNMDVQCSPFQASVIHGFIQTLESGGSLSVPANKVVINEEIIADINNTDDAFIANYGIGDDPGPRGGVAAVPLPAGLKVGVSMPTQSLQRWNEDGAYLKQYFENQGYEVDLQYGGDNDVATQISQIENMISGGCSVLVIVAIDGDSLTEVLAEAKANNIPVIAYDRLIMNTDAVTYYATFDNTLVGTLQGQYIKEQLDLDNAEGPFNIEFFTGDPGDNNIYFFFGGAMEVLQPYLDSGKLVCPSGQTEIMQVATEGWKTENAQSRMENLISANGYSPTGTKLDAVMCSNDSTAQGVTNALRGAGYSGEAGNFPIITGQDCDIVSVRNMIAGEQSMSVFKDTRLLADRVVSMVTSILTGSEPELNDWSTYDNGTGIIPSYLCVPVFGSADNFMELLIDTGYYTLADLGLS